MRPDEQNATKQQEECHDDDPGWPTTDQNATKQQQEVRPRNKRRYAAYEDIPCGRPINLDVFRQMSVVELLDSSEYFLNAYLGWRCWLNCSLAALGRSDFDYRNELEDDLDDVACVLGEKLVPENLSRRVRSAVATNAGHALIVCHHADLIAEYGEVIRLLNAEDWRRLWEIGYLDFLTEEEYLDLLRKEPEPTLVPPFEAEPDPGGPTDAEELRLCSVETLFSKLATTEGSRQTDIGAVIGEKLLEGRFPQHIAWKVGRSIANAYHESKLHLRGAITKATTHGALMGVTFFTLELEGETAADCMLAGKFVVHLTSKTRVVKWVNGRDEKAKLGDLQQGVCVEIQLDDDEVMESAPPEAEALLVRILPRALCQAQQEAASPPSAQQSQTDVLLA